MSSPLIQFKNSASTKNIKTKSTASSFPKKRKSNNTVLRFFPACLLVLLLALGFYPATSALAQAQRPAEREEREDPGARARWERLRLQDEHGQILPNALINAAEQKNAMSFRPQAWSELLGAGTTIEGIQPYAGVSRSIWSSIGPGNIGGRIRSIIIHPTSPNTMWVGAVAGGVWKTTRLWFYGAAVGNTGIVAPGGDIIPGIEINANEQMAACPCSADVHSNAYRETNSKTNSAGSGYGADRAFTTPLDQNQRNGVGKPSESNRASFE